MGWWEIFQATIPLFLGLFSGWVAARIARKTPHENLKTLVEIQADLDPNIDTCGAIEKSIKLELRRLEHSTVTADKKWREVLWARILDNPTAVLAGCFVVVGSAMFVVVMNRVGGASSGEGAEGNGIADIVWAIVGVLVAASLALAATYVSYRRDRTLLRRDTQSEA